VVVRAEASWAASAAPFSDLLRSRPGDIVWAPGPIWSTLTLFAIWHALETGVPVIATGTGRRSDAAGGPPHVGSATVVQAVPAVIREVVAEPPPALRLAVAAGSHLPAGLRQHAADAAVGLLEYYGAAELSFVAVDPDGSGLRPFPGVEVELRDEPAGELWVRSPYLALGYLGGGPGPYRQEAGGWATVGDRARWLTARAGSGDAGSGPGGDEFEVLGRGDDTVTTGGHTVPLSDVEAALRHVEGVAELVCVAAPDRRLGQRLIAFVEPRPGTDPRPALRSAARAGLPRPARPVGWVLADRLPRLPNGKVDRKACRP
jgi:long-chain acyl-CoA synthetase